jgi:thymidylate synthase ThyX
LGFDAPEELREFGLADAVAQAMSRAAKSHRVIESELGPVLAQYVVPMGYRLRWYFRANLREVIHLCELRTQVQGHPDYRWLAQEMFRRVQDVHPRLAAFATFVDMSPGDELARRQSERRLDLKLRALKS